MMKIKVKLRPGVKRLLLFFALAPPLQVLADPPDPIVIIVNQSNPLTSLTPSAIANIYKGREGRWENGQRIYIINRPASSNIRRYFYGSVLNAKPTKLYFKKGSPIPFKMKIVGSDLVVKKFVARLGNAISYIRKSSVDDSVKVVYSLPTTIAEGG